MTSGVNLDFLLIFPLYHDIQVSYFCPHNIRKSMQKVYPSRKPNCVRFAANEIFKSPTFDLLLPDELIGVRSVILLCHRVVILFLNPSMLPRKTTLEHTDITDVLDIIATLTLKILHSAIVWVHARYVWFIFSNTAQTHRKSFIKLYTFDLACNMAVRALYLACEGLLAFLWVFCVFRS